MTKQYDRKELIDLSGQIVNGMLSADSSFLTKILDRTIHNTVADSAVNIAVRILDNIDKKCENK